MKKLITMLLALIFLMTAAVYADGIAVKAEIPVTCIGEKGSFVLLDEGGEIDRITLGGGTSGVLAVELHSLDYFSFTVKQVDMTAENVDYDLSVYDVKVAVILDENEQPIACITVYEDDAGNKVDEIVFRNFNTYIPATGDTSDMLLWGSLAGGAAAAIILMLIFTRRRDRNEEENRTS